MKKALLAANLSGGQACTAKSGTYVLKRTGLGWQGEGGLYPSISESSHWQSSLNAPRAISQVQLG